MKVSQSFRFEAAHFLPNVPDTHKCKRMHGHSYRVELILSGKVDERSGFVIDFFEIEEIAGPVISSLDHRCLNDIDGLENPTAENISKWIWERLAPSLPKLTVVRVFETPESWVEYCADD